ncbi:hypothetical protein F5Y01DRAFT_22360 [Xylaria sp. FL0043]|nr:hypothetical protein F5Y01DRAFT_22360 [Xylaria sp. FL0043]
MKTYQAFVAVILSLLLNTSFISGFAITARDFAAPIQDLFLNPRGKPSSSKGGSRGGGSGSGSTGPKQSSKLKKGSDPKDADAELSDWGMTRSRTGLSESVPAPFHWEDESNDLYESVEGKWEQSEITPDDSHSGQYGPGRIYLYQTNQEAGAFHTDEVYTTVDPINHGQRSLPVNRRDLTYNAWIHAGGDPQNLKMFSDENIVNEDAKRAFEDTFAEKGLDVTVGDQYVRLDRNDPAWSKWDNGANPFPDGYETMTIDYSDMQSTISYVMLYVDSLGAYHAVHVLEHVADLERRLQARAAYFLRRNLTDPWMI